MARSGTAGALLSELVLDVSRLIGILLEAGDARPPPDVLTSAR